MAKTIENEVSGRIAGLSIKMLKGQENRKKECTSKDFKTNLLNWGESSEEMMSKRFKN